MINLSASALVILWGCPHRPFGDDRVNTHTRLESIVITRNSTCARGEGAPPIAKARARPAVGLLLRVAAFFGVLFFAVAFLVVIGHAPFEKAGLRGNIEEIIGDR